MDTDLEEQLCEVLCLDGRSSATSRSAGQKLKKKLQSQAPPESKPVLCATSARECQRLRWNILCVSDRVDLLHFCCAAASKNSLVCST